MFMLCRVRPALESQGNNWTLARNCKTCQENISAQQAHWKATREWAKLLDDIWHGKISLENFKMSIRFPNRSLFGLPLDFHLFVLPLVQLAAKWKMEE